MDEDVTIGGRVSVRDVLFDALRVRHLEEFFSRLSDELQ